MDEFHAELAKIGRLIFLLWLLCVKARKLHFSFNVPKVSFRTFSTSEFSTRLNRSPGRQLGDFILFWRFAKQVPVACFT